MKTEEITVTDYDKTIEKIDKEAFGEFPLSKREQYLKNIVTAAGCISEELAIQFFRKAEYSDESAISSLQGLVNRNILFEIDGHYSTKPTGIVDLNMFRALAVLCNIINTTGICVVDNLISARQPGKLLTYYEGKMIEIFVVRNTEPGFMFYLEERNHVFNLRSKDSITYMREEKDVNVDFEDIYLPYLVMDDESLIDKLPAVNFDYTAAIVKRDEQENLQIYYIQVEAEERE